MYRLLVIAALVGTAHAATAANSTVSENSTTVTTTPAGYTGPLRCQNADRTFMSSAFKCVDKLSSCASIFRGIAGGSSRPALCDNDHMQDKASQCAKTCGICCEQSAYNCVDSPISPINCAANKRFCNTAAWAPIMAQYCPATCGKCGSASVTTSGTASGSKCVDIGANCADHVDKCNDPIYYDSFTTNCAKTCNRCQCVDIASNCNAQQCNLPDWYDIMTSLCAKTCKRCGVSAASCKNANPNCGNWGTTFCTNPYYTQQQKKEHCARMCNLC